MLWLANGLLFTRGFSNWTIRFAGAMIRRELVYECMLVNIFVAVSDSLEHDLVFQL